MSSKMPTDRRFVPAFLLASQLAASGAAPLAVGQPPTADAETRRGVLLELRLVEPDYVLALAGASWQPVEDRRDGSLGQYALLDSETLLPRLEGAPVALAITWDGVEVEARFGEPIGIQVGLLPRSKGSGGWTTDLDVGQIAIQPAMPIERIGELIDMAGLELPPDRSLVVRGLFPFMTPRDDAGSGAEGAEPLRHLADALVVTSRPLPLGGLKEAGAKSEREPVYLSLSEVTVRDLMTVLQHSFAFEWRYEGAGAERLDENVSIFAEGLPWDVPLRAALQHVCLEAVEQSAGVWAVRDLPAPCGASGRR